MVCSVIALGTVANASVRMNEIVADNESGLRDEEGEFSDWIELSSTSTEVLELEGWSLSDDPEVPDKWTLPAYRLPPGGRVLVFASGKDRVEGQEWHANFRLSREGEYLGLFDPSGLEISAFSPAFPALSADHSFAYDSASKSYRIFRTPTPLASNEEAPELGPRLFAPMGDERLAQEGEDHVVSVAVQSNGDVEVTEVELLYRVLHKTESRLPMRDDGVSPDAVAGDGRFTGAIPATTLFGKRFQQGELVRWAFRAEDEEGRVSRLPAVDPEVVAQPEYFGTIVAQDGVDTALPILHWFTDDSEAAVTERGARASVYFDGQFYDNLFVRRRGQFGAIGWSKPKLKFDFNPRDHFRYDPERRRVEEFNLQSHFNDASFMRENLAFALFNRIGTPASDTRHWHVRLNADFFGLFSFVEQVDEDFLRQQGLDPEGALYKANGFPSTLARVVTEALYQKETRKDEPYDDLIAFAQGINSAGRFDYIMDHVNLPAMVNEMAGQALIRNADRLTKNYYMYRDPNTDLWQRFPWDMDGAFSTSSGLANENFASPLYGDSQHTQAAGQPIYQNFLLDAILDHKITRQMYLRRLRTLIDHYLQPDSTYLKGEVERREELIAADARKDAAEWSTGNISNGVSTLVNTAWSLRRRELLETFGKDLVPAPATLGLVLGIDEVDPAPGSVSEEYFRLSNPNDEAIDLSGWTVEGAVRFQFPSGAVIPRKGTLFSPDDGILYIVKDIRGFRERFGGKGLFYLGGYDGRLSNGGETIRVLDAEGSLVVEHAYEGVGVSYEDWASEHFTESELLDPAISGPNADPEELGASNLFRYAFGSESGAPLVTDGKGVRYRRVRGASDLAFFLEESPDLQNWKRVASDEVIESGGDDPWETVSLPAVEGQGSFYRIRVQLEMNP